MDYFFRSFAQTLTTNLCYSNVDTFYFYFSIKKNYYPLLRFVSSDISVIM